MYVTYIVLTNHSILLALLEESIRIGESVFDISTLYDTVALQKLLESRLEFFRFSLFFFKYLKLPRAFGAYN
jgi:hypothetical protein